MYRESAAPIVTEDRVELRLTCGRCQKTRTALNGGANSVGAALSVCPCGHETYVGALTGAPAQELVEQRLGRWLGRFFQ